MAIATLGTAAQTTLMALAHQNSGAGLSPADIASIAAAIKDDKEATIGGFNPNKRCYSQNGILQIPRRGWLRMLPGDYVAVDATGWPILLSSFSAASASWVHT